MAGPHGIGRINFVQMTWYGTDHSYILDLIAAEPDRFVGTGIVPAVTDIDVGSPSRQMSALARGGVYAFRVRGGSARPILLGAGPRWLDHPGYQEMFEAGARENLAISFLMDPVDIPEVDRMCGLYPDTPVIVDHLCRIGADGEFREEDIAAFCGLAKHRSVLVKVGPFNHLGIEGQAVPGRAAAGGADDRRIRAGAVHVGERQPRAAAGQLRCRPSRRLRGGPGADTRPCRPEPFGPGPPAVRDGGAVLLRRTFPPEKGMNRRGRGGRRG